MAVWTPKLSNARIEHPTSSAAAVAIRPLRCTLTFDRTWSPYIQGTLVCERQSSSDATATDPRSGQLIKWTMSQGLLGGTQQTLNMTAWLRSRVNDFGTDEATLTFASVESIMQDQIDLSGNTYEVSQSDQSMLHDAFARIPLYNTGVLTDSNPGGSAGFTVATADAGWDAGSSIWAIVETIESPKALWIRGDESGLAILRMAQSYTADSSTHYLYGADQSDGTPGRVISVTDTISLDSPDYANGVYINYSWNSGANSATDYATVGTPTLLKDIVINRTGKRTSTGEAAARAARMVKRGRTLVVKAIADLTCRPNQNYFVGFRDVTWYGIVRAVTFTFPEGVMDVTIDITESLS